MAHGEITHVEIPVTDFEQAKSFYGEVFGWQIMDAEGMPDYPMWQSANGTGGALTRREEGFTQPRSVAEVDSIDEALAKVERLGGTVLVPKSEVSPTSWWALFADPEGNQVGLFEGEM